MWVGFVRWCLPNMQAHIRRPEPSVPPCAPGTIKSRAAWRRRPHRNAPAPPAAGGQWVFTPLARSPSGIPLARDPGGERQEVPSRLHRAPPPSSHLRRGARLGAAKKGAVMQPATRHYRCATGCVNKKRGPTPSRAPQHLTTHKVHASLGPKNMQNEFRAHAHATNSVCSSAVRLWHAS